MNNQEIIKIKSIDFKRSCLNYRKNILHLGLTGNHIQDLNRAIEYLQNLKNGLLVQEFGDLEDEAVRIMSKAKGDSTDHSKDNAEYVPRSFSRM